MDEVPVREAGDATGWPGAVDATQPPAAAAAPRQPGTDDELVRGAADHEILHRLISVEMGDKVAEAMDSDMRHLRDGLRGADLRSAVNDGLVRAARLLEGGLRSLDLPRGTRARTQALEAERAAEEARLQVLKALKQARAAWESVRRERGGGRR